MRLQVRDFIWEPELVSEKAYASRHTGRQLSKTVIEFQAPREKPSSLEEALSIAKSQGVTSIDEDGDVITNWKVAERSRSYSSNDRYETVQWEITEVEQLNCHRLILGELEVVPHQYSETIWRGGIMISLVAELSLDQRERLEAFRTESEKYFQVIRDGVSNDQLEMRFGQLVWSQNDEKYSQGITLIEKRSDESEGDEGLGSVFSSKHSDVHLLQKKFALLTIQNNHLLDLLQAKALLTQEERTNLIKSSPEEIQSQLVLFEEVRDLEKWFERNN